MHTTDPPRRICHRVLVLRLCGTRQPTAHIRARTILLPPRTRGRAAEHAVDAVQDAFVAAHDDKHHDRGGKYTDDVAHVWDHGRLEWHVDSAQSVGRVVYARRGARGGYLFGAAWVLASVFPSFLVFLCVFSMSAVTASTPFR